MYFKKVVLILTSLFILAVFCGCDAVDSLFTSGDTYKINAYIGEVSLDECSFIALEDEITPFFEEFVSKDPDITSLIISIAKAGEDIPGWRTVYSLKKETEQYSRAIQVDSLDIEVPSFIIPENLPAGFYSMVFKVMGGKNVLQRTEKDFYYMGNIQFSYEGIDVHLPGISENQQLISKGQVVLLEAKLEFDPALDPYFIWYNGKNIITEGSYSEGASLVLWKAPEHSNFYQLSAEVLPVKGFDTLAGYSRNLSVLVSSNAVDVNLISENVPELVNWYVFEGNLNDSKTASVEAVRSITPSNNNINIDPKWLPANGTYGLAAGFGNAFTLPKTVVPTGRDSWQLLFRFMSLEEGSILSVNFGASANVVMDLSIVEKNIVLTLSSPLRNVSRVYNLPLDKESFITMGVSFSVAPGLVTAKVNVLGETAEEGELALAPLRLEANAGYEFQILLGQVNEEAPSAEQGEADDTQEEQEETIRQFDPYFTAIWDEFALYNKPPMELIVQEIKSAQIYE
ncbi:MAG: hypothetical protein LBU88_02675 [Treponema sp.]|nr:hypothetical protein [Treponema sp.]